MDEKRLAELLKDAVADTPPPTFDHGDVTAESERQRVRHRNGVLAGSAFGVALLAGAAALGVALWTGPGSWSRQPQRVTEPLSVTETLLHTSYLTRDVARTANRAWRSRRLPAGDAQAGGLFGWEWRACGARRHS